MTTDLSGCESISDVSGLSGLRLRSLFRLDDLSGNLHQMYPLIRPNSFEQIAEYRPSKLNEYYFQAVIFFIRFFNQASVWISAGWLFLKTVVKSVKRGMRDNIYVFFEGSSYPYYLDDMQMNSPAIPPVEWYYNAKTRTFITSRLYNNSQQYHTHHIPYLTAEVKYNELVLYDISEFVDSVRWAGEDGEGMPNADHLVSAWTLSSGIVLQRSDAMSLSVINTDGRDIRVPLRAA